MPVVPPTVAVPPISAPSVNSPEVLPTSTKPPTKEATAVRVTEPPTRVPTAVTVAEPPTREATAVVVTDLPTQEPTKVVVTEPPISSGAAPPFEVIQPVAEPAKVAILKFSVDPATVEGMINLCYETENAVEVVTEPDIGSVLQQGKELDKGCIEWPQKPEISSYTLIAYGESGETEKLPREYDYLGKP
jgi:hypothetical protein